MAVQIDKDVFGKRLKSLYSAWQKNRDTLWEGSNALAVPVGATSDDLRYLKSISLHLWLFGYELPDTIMLFLESALHVLTSGKKADLLVPLKEAAQAAGVALTLHVKAKGQDGSEQMRSMLAALPKPAKVGTLPKDKHEGALVALWASQLEGSGVALADVSSGFGDLFACKDETEVLASKKAAFLASKVMRDYVVNRLEDILDKEKKVKHAKLAEATEEAITEPTKVGVKLKAENVDIAYPPIFQSGGRYDLKLSAASDDAPLHPGIILVSLGTRYSSYCSNIGRTYLINPTKLQEEQYNALLAAQEAAIAALVEGAPLSAPYDAAAAKLRSSSQPALADKLPKNVGFGMGLEFREGGSVLGPKGGVLTVRPGMVFNVCVGVAGLEDPSAPVAKSRNYALQIADTVVVRAAGQEPEVLTASCQKDWAVVSYTLNEKDDDDAEVVDAFDDVTNGIAAPGGRKALRSEDPNYRSAEQQRKEKQEELLAAKNAETLRRLTAQQAGGGADGASTGGRLISQVNAYRNASDIMPGTSQVAAGLQVLVDSRAESLLLPIYGVLVPFHITTVKSVTSNQDNDHAYIRLSFNFGGAFEPAQRFPNLIFLKELSFKTADVRHATKVVQDIKLLRSSVLQRDKERAERATLVAQEKLVRGKKVFRLSDLWVRPSFGGKGRKLPGILEAHQNGFRYSTPKGEAIDVMYRNIRHAFFQPAEKEMVTIVHFHLVNPIMLGNKKTQDVQFYAELADVVQTLDGGRRSMYDPDEIEEEQRERDRRNKMNTDFGVFVKRVQEHWEREYPDLQLEFDIPFRELAFEGVPHRSTVSVMPTVNCLVELTEMPFMVVSLEDIELINLERVGFNLKNFDMAIVFKDFARDVLRIDAIPSKKLDTIKEWLTSINIKYYESKMNLAWKPILKNIKEDPEGFIEQGGWDFLNMDKSDSDEEGGEESSEGYAPSGGEEEEEEESDSDGSDSDASLVDSDQEASAGDDEDEDEEDEEEGKSWEELEEEARWEDKRKVELSDDEGDQRRGGKRKAAPPAAATAKRRR